MSTFIANPNIIHHSTTNPYAIVREFVARSNFFELRFHPALHKDKTIVHLLSTPVDETHYFNLVYPTNR